VETRGVNSAFNYNGVALDVTKLTVNLDMDVVTASGPALNANNKLALTKGAQVILLVDEQNNAVVKNLGSEGVAIVTGLEDGGYSSGQQQTRLQATPGTDYVVGIGLDNGNLKATYEGQHVNHNRAGVYTYGVSARTALLNNTYDGLLSTLDQWKTGENGGNAIASLRPSHTKTKVGSSVTNDSVGFLLGGGWNSDTQSGKLAVGAVIEGGVGDYDSHSTFGNADGDTWNYGIAGFVKHQFTGGAYLDGSARVGRVKADFDSNDLGATGASYNSKSQYFGAHIGAGYNFKLDQSSSLDGYAKLIWVQQNGDSVNTKAAEHLSFSSVDSLRTRVGLRYTQEVQNRFRAYGGLAWEHETDGKVSAKINGEHINYNNDLKGNSGLVEAGIAWNADKNWSLNAGVQGVFGKRQGGAGSVTANYKF
jgi:outer membrane autotransporter protein